MSNETKRKVVIIGAGPAGLTAGTELLKKGTFSVTILERDEVIGGLAKTTEHRGCRYDIGPHHFITTEKKIEAWWKSLMQEDFYPHKRFTRIFYNNHFFHYPLRPLNALRGLNFFEALRCVGSYIKVQLFPFKPAKSFAEYVTNKFGHRLFTIFFKTYTEKVWGISCHEISPEWAAQRIKGFSLFKAIFFAFFGKLLGKKFKKSMSEAFAAESDIFYYPSKGSGTLWEKVAAQITNHPDGSIHLQESVIGLEHNHHQIIAVQTAHLSPDHATKITRVTGDHFLSTMPLKALINALSPKPSAEIIAAANALLYRGLITINLKVNKKALFKDHWIYIHEPRVKVLRIGNMNNFSHGMVDHLDHTALSLEYFDVVGSPFWLKSEAELLALGAQELEIIGLAKTSEIIDGMVQWSPEAYPVYDAHYQKNLTLVTSYLAQFTNLNLMGRNGMHRYFNMDVAMMSAFKVVDQITIRNEEKPILQQL